MQEKISSLFESHESNHLKNQTNVRKIPSQKCTYLTDNFSENEQKKTHQFSRRAIEIMQINKNIL